ncbi:MULTISPECIES: MBL fold metallo-hydrolase [unclassified Methanoregula]|uniref:MBL fold metallo-hydrolase n=1 Tax=unclassified Methanoregula TaxID=2649730 RepID=UPI0009C7CF6E|nr:MULTISPECIES: MBL fold metallo-hydrolase [unclassified Methanoregula]OPX64690.1 MAG: hydroxyacylglutathione hydrolase [Methanoregula sp. PtaB.Bin085]OPY36058.1 MAG: hydroxyacylglutathione hydrolase [Methanoregula sp. PtaU1.Bin006]
MEIVPGIHQVDGVNGNSYILVRDGLVVIDTGLPGSGKTILAYIRNTLNREPSEIATIVLTHFHTDHVGGTKMLKAAAPGLKIAIHEADAAYVAGTRPLPRYPGLRGIALDLFARLMTRKFPPDILLKDGDRIARLSCVHLPGHTPGSAGFLDAETGTLFAGDLLRWDGTTLSEGPAGFTIDIASSRNSIRKIASLPFETLLIGHGKPLRPRAAAKVREFAGSLPAA